MLDSFIQALSPSSRRKNRALLDARTAKNQEISGEDFELLCEYDLLASHCPRNLYVLPDFRDLRHWHGCLFIHRGLYRNLTVRFSISIPTIMFPSSSTSGGMNKLHSTARGGARSGSTGTSPGAESSDPTASTFYPHSMHGVEVIFRTHFPHPLVDPETGRLDLAPLVLTTNNYPQNRTKRRRRGAQQEQQGPGGVINSSSTSPAKLIAGEAQEHPHRNLILLLQYVKAVFLKKELILHDEDHVTGTHFHLLNPEFGKLLHEKPEKARKEVALAVEASSAEKALFNAHAGSIVFQRPRASTMMNTNTAGGGTSKNNPETKGGRDEDTLGEQLLGQKTKSDVDNKRSKSAAKESKKDTRKSSNEKKKSLERTKTKEEEDPRRDFFPRAFAEVLQHRDLRPREKRHMLVEAFFEKYS
ncbi:unnamed protein product [Amoebophrya sp. A120]|nr:unnamed protein product [Amoebophrya sp. A120]|eukprot:GSA120T00001220001.1